MAASLTSFIDMLGFKLEVPAKVQGTERPIYLDMQVGQPLEPIQIY